MAINDMIMPGVKNPLLAVAEEIRKQISAKAMTPPQTSPPVAGMPEDRDYTEGMQRPDLTKLKAEREFKATPSRTSAFLVALGNILQDKQNLEAAKQQTEQSEYNAKLADAMELNKLFKTGKMKREFDESDPDTQLKREAFQTEQEHKKKMYPLEEKKAQAYIDKLLKGGSGSSRASVGGQVDLSSLSPEELTLYKKYEAQAHAGLYDEQNQTETIEDRMEDLIMTDMSKLGKGGQYQARALSKVLDKIKRDTTPDKIPVPKTKSSHEQSVEFIMNKYKVDREAAENILNQAKAGNALLGQINMAQSFNQSEGETTTPQPQPTVPAPTAKPQSKYIPGTIVKVRGKVMKVTNAQGDLEEVK
jgi:hypothetical protein